MSFKKVNINELMLNPFTLIGDEWMLITAGDEDKHNTMTASWGGLGFLWKKPVSTIYIRPQRYTREFVDNNDFYSICFFDSSYKKALSFCGANSGRDVDKDKECGLTPVHNLKAPFYEEAKMVLICNKLYKQTMTPESFIDDSIIPICYPNSDFHHVYVGEIVDVLVKENN